MYANKCCSTISLAVKVHLICCAIPQIEPVELTFLRQQERTPPGVLVTKRSPTESFQTALSIGLLKVPQLAMPLQGGASATFLRHRSRP